MTSHELARLLLAGPDLLVVKQAHEPNEDSFDSVERIESRDAWQVDYGSGWSHDLFDGPGMLPHRAVPIVVIR